MNTPDKVTQRPAAGVTPHRPEVGGLSRPPLADGVVVYPQAFTAPPTAAGRTPAGDPPIRQREWVWLTWLFASLGSFGVIEYLAVRHHHLSTLSIALRRWAGIHPYRAGGRMTVATSVGILVWLIAHLTRMEKTTDVQEKR